MGGNPPKLALQSRGVDGITTVVSRPVGNVDDLLRIRFAIRAGSQAVQLLTKTTYQGKIGNFVPTAYVVGSPRRACLQHPADGVAMVGNVQPIAPLLAIAI
ncbi:hypothetical protein D3C72_1705280 [compost metagenome]